MLEHFGLLGAEDVIVTGTLGKALGGAAGGFVAGGEALCAVLEQRSRPQLFSNGARRRPSPPARAARSAELRDNPDLVARLRRNTARMREGLVAAGLEPLEGESAIVPIIVGETARAIEISRKLLDRGVYVTGFGYPVVPEGTARIRIQVSAALDRGADRGRGRDDRRGRGRGRRHQLARAARRANTSAHSTTSLTSTCSSGDGRR